ncbi:hypothetical protein [Nocardia wallacei]|uniref:hypothetical protein n=1 Tax=Nocardia wallacei TaxID=480035 RepID=UPI0024549839|nr:hypothetical protein [Nocardia wallacei]
MAVRVTGVGEYPVVHTFEDADSFEVDGQDHLVVRRGGTEVAVCHRNHWSCAGTADAREES